jgi:hypothetical protein
MMGPGNIQGSIRGHPVTSSDILIFGTGSFAQRIACDLAATATTPTRVAIAGRNAHRLAWIATAARARAHMFARPVTIDTHAIDLATEGRSAELLAKRRPAVIVQAASLQTASVIAGVGNAWTRLVADGGLSATAVFQAVLTSRIARAAAQVSPHSHLINCCFPDVANGIVAAMGLPVTCGIGNIAILAHAFAGTLESPFEQKLHMLCHYQNIAAWRRPPEERSGPTARVWLAGSEIADIFSRFAAVQLTAQPVIDISGGSGVTLLLAMAQGQDWSGHVPGPAGLPGGYPVALKACRLDLDLPPGLDRVAAIAWNARYEVENGLVVAPGGRAHYTGRLYDGLRAESPDIAAGFAVGDLEQVCQAMGALRDRMLSRPA